MLLGTHEGFFSSEQLRKFLTISDDTLRPGALKIHNFNSFGSNMLFFLLENSEFLKINHIPFVCFLLSARPNLDSRFR